MKAVQLNGLSGLDSLKVVEIDRPAPVMKVMGHTDARTAMKYQHPVLDPIREAIDQRNLRHNLRHSELTVQ